MNYANGDMVGHTGIYSAIEKAVTAIDNCVKDTVEAMPEEITNKLYYETERGNTTCEFKLDVPVMEINGLYNEFADRRFLMLSILLFKNVIESTDVSIL